MLKHSYNSIIPTGKLCNSTRNSDSHSCRETRTLLNVGRECLYVRGITSARSIVIIWAPFK